MIVYRIGFNYELNIYYLLNYFFDIITKRVIVPRLVVTLGTSHNTLHMVIITLGLFKLIHQ